MNKSLEDAISKLDDKQIDILKSGCDIGILKYHIITLIRRIADGMSISKNRKYSREKIDILLHIWDSLIQYEELMLRSEE